MPSRPATKASGSQPRPTTKPRPASNWERTRDAIYFAYRDAHACVFRLQFMLTVPREVLSIYALDPKALRTVKVTRGRGKKLRFTPVRRTVAAQRTHVEEACGRSLEHMARQYSDLIRSFIALRAADPEMVRAAGRLYEVSHLVSVWETAEKSAIAATRELTRAVLIHGNLSVLHGFAWHDENESLPPDLHGVVLGGLQAERPDFIVRWANTFPDLKAGLVQLDKRLWSEQEALLEEMKGKGSEGTSIWSEPEPDGGGWTKRQLTVECRVKGSTFDRIRQRAKEPGGKRGQHSFIYTRAAVWRLVAVATDSSRPPKWREAGERWAQLLEKRAER